MNETVLTVNNVFCPECEPDNAAARVRDLCQEHSQTPMRRDFPTICEWVRHGCVNSGHLRVELLRALELISA